jgi:hypothetical protein
LTGVFPERTTQPRALKSQSDIKTAGKPLTRNHNEKENGDLEDTQALWKFGKLPSDRYDNAPYIHEPHSESWSETMDKGDKYDH